MGVILDSTSLEGHLAAMLRRLWSAVGSVDGDRAPGRLGPGEHDRARGRHLWLGRA